MMARLAILLTVISIPLVMFADGQKEPENNDVQKEHSTTTDKDEACKERAKQFQSLDWKAAGTYKLLESGSTISLPDDYLIVVGKDAQKEEVLIEGLSAENADQTIEAVIYDTSFDNRILFQNFKSGFVSLDDFGEIDAKSFLKSISENTENDNLRRKENGMTEVHIVGWLQEPTLDKESHTIYWGIEAIQGQKDKTGEHIVNSVALRLGRYGFEKITWVSDKQIYSNLGGHLASMLRAHSFDQGSRYTDFKPGDSLASYGIATLVAATLGAKAAKAAGLAILFKKLGVFIVAGIALLWSKVKGIFKRDSTC